uniref:Guanylate-kinase-associated protein n=1 Tax=Anopheles melas TaxID=34690 RepID=A0A182U3T7_9DIPT
MLPVINCQAVTSVLDPVTGHISTVLTTTTAPNGQQQQQQQQALQPLLSGTGDSSPTAATNKKPSYLNLACCVNGYSNLTTYDSKLRQDINKSREVSPSRPIIATLHYNRTETGAGGHLLAAPTLSYVSMNNTINNNNNNNNNNYSASTGGNRMLKMNGAGVVNGGAAGRMRGMNGSILSPPSGGADMTDNVGMFNGNGSFAGSMRTKVISSQSQISSHARDEATAQMLMTPKKSFIQQRVEKLYGASEVVVLNKQNYSSSERKYLNNIANDNTSGGTPVKLFHHGSTAQTGQQQQHHHPMGNGTARNGVANGAAGGLHVTNGGTNGGSVHDENGQQLNGAAEVSNGSDEADVESLPVLRHLRPEFRAQLQIFSPKKMPKPSAPPANRTTAVNGSAATHANGNTAEENVTLTTGPKRYTQSNGNSSNTDHLEQQQQQHSLVREEQDHRTTVTNRSTMVADGVEFGEDINGYILVAVGKARLLCSQKMKQFEDLCYTNLNQSPDEKFQTTGEDLRGFWDMVMLQVNNVDASFAEIDSFRKNGWRKPAPKSPPPPARNGTAGATRTKLVKRPYKTGGTANGTTVTDGSNGVEAKKASAALAAAKREAQRKQLMEMKRKQKLANSQQQTAVEIFAPASDEPAAQPNGVGGGDDNNCSTAVVPPVGTAAAAATTTLVDTS